MKKGYQELHKFLNKLHYVYVKLQVFHWNVEGKNFMEYHKFFEEKYNQVLQKKDMIAENLRLKGEKVVLDLPSMPAVKLPKNAKSMLEEALKDFEELYKTSASISDPQDTALHETLMQFCIDDSKTIFFLKSTLAE